MRVWIPLAIPMALFVSLAALVTGYPGVAAWPESPLFRAMPYALLALCFGLGAWLTQTRVSLVALLAGGVTFFLQYTTLIRPDPARTQTVVLMASIYLPCFAMVFTHMSERGLLTRPGLARIIVVFASIVLIVALTGLRRFDDAAARVPPAALRPAADWLCLPWAGVAAAVLCVPGFIKRKPHESPLLGPLMGIGVLFALTALNFGSPVWGQGRGDAVLPLFMAGSAAAMMWAVLEGVWRNATMDELTELPGRRMLKHHLARLGSSYAIAVLDIDHFKRFNDRYGHDAGDQVLRFVAARLRACRAGRSYRYGGEEFVLINDRGDETFLDAMEELRETLASSRFVIRAKGRPRRKPEQPLMLNGARQNLAVTVSIGVAWKDGRSPTARDVLGAADRALYRAKAAGRNRVMSAKRTK
jgi:diguanylate cyclase (GGDEF)-like protein